MMDSATQTDKPQLIKDAKGKRPAFFEETGVDQLMSMVMVLSSELAVLRDRVDAGERAAANNGIDLAAEIEKLELDENALQEREAWRQAFFDRLFYYARKQANEAAASESKTGYDNVIDDIAKN